MLGGCLTLVTSDPQDGGGSCRGSEAARGEVAGHAQPLGQMDGQETQEGQLTNPHPGSLLTNPHPRFTIPYPLLSNHTPPLTNPNTSPSVLEHITLIVSRFSMEMQIKTGHNQGNLFVIDLFICWFLLFK